MTLTQKALLGSIILAPGALALAFGERGQWILAYVAAAFGVFMLAGTAARVGLAGLFEPVQLPVPCNDRGAHEGVAGSGAGGGGRNTGNLGLA